ncbi:MAG: NUDIX domain-containing protein [Bacteroidota bacterium]
MSFTYEYPRPALTTDCVVFAWTPGGLEILLVQRGIAPYEGSWALPGGFVGMDEELEASARRELQEETGLTDMYLEQLFTFGGIERDPRGRVVTVAYYALIDKGRFAPPKGDTDARDARWFSLDSVPELAFDHAKILEYAIERLRAKVRYAPVGFELLPEKFALSELQQLYENVLGEELDKRNFRKKLMGLDILLDLNERKQEAPFRSAKLYRFDESKYRALAEKGMNFRI